MAQGAALQCSEPSVIPLSYPGAPREHTTLGQGTYVGY